MLSAAYPIFSETCALSSSYDSSNDTDLASPCPVAPVEPVRDAGDASEAGHFQALIAWLDANWQTTVPCQEWVHATGIPLQRPRVCQAPAFEAVLFQTSLTAHLPQKTVSDMLARFPGKLLIFHYVDGLIDCALASPIAPKPVFALDIRWQDDGHFQALSRVGSPLELLLRLQCYFGKQKLRRKFVVQFRHCLHKVSRAWTGLCQDDAETRRSLAFDTLLRLIFLAFLETRGLLDGRTHFILEEADLVRQKGQCIFDDFLRPFYFGTLNVPPGKRAKRAAAFGKIPFLNGGLFQPTPSERLNPKRTLPNDIVWDVLITLLDGWEFSDHETRHHDAALDPMMLGHVFEMLMPSEFRSHTGSFYTPMPLVRDIVCRAFANWASFTFDMSVKNASDLFGIGVVHDMSAARAEACFQRLLRIRILDIASGSGAFLQAAFECLHRAVSALMLHSGHTPHPSTLAREIVLHNLYGVDILEAANRICELRLWLATLKYYQKDELLPPLPNLDRNIRCGHSLMELSQYAMTLGFSPNEIFHNDAAVASLRKRYGVATGSAKQRLAVKMEALDRSMEAAMTQCLCERLEAQLHALKKQAQASTLFEGVAPTPNMREQIRQLESHLSSLKARKILGTFSFDIHFADIMAEGGFDILLGNPPWFGLHTRPEEEKQTLRRLFQVAQGSRMGNKCTQSMDMSALFVEKSLCLAKPGGIVAMLLPNKLFHAPSYAAFRRYTETHAQCLFSDDWSESDKNTFDAVAYPAGLVLRKLDPKSRQIDVWFSQADACRIQIQRPEPLQRALTSVPLTVGSVYPIRQGIKTGANDIFLCTLLERHADISLVQFKNHAPVPMETSLLYPILRGSDISPYHVCARRHLVMTHDHDMLRHPLSDLPPLAGAWFAQHEERLRERQCIRASKIYALSGVSEQLFCPKVVWRDISEELWACYVDDRTLLPLNTSYYIPVPDELTGLLLAAWLNSSHIRQVCRSRAEHAKNGYRRFFAWLIHDIPWPFMRVSEDDPLIRQIVEISRQAHAHFDSVVRSPKRQAKLDHLVLKAIMRQGGGMS